MLLLRDVLGFAAAAGARLAGRDAALERPVTGGNVMQVPTDAFARVGDVVFAPTTVFWSAAAGPATLLEALAARGVAAVALRGPDVEELADALAWTARRHDVPLLLLGARVHLNDVLNELLAALGAPSRADLERGSAVQDQLAELVLGGWELDALPDAIAEVTRDDVVLVGSDGAAIAGSAGADRRAAERVARRRLRAARRDGGSAEPGEEGWIVVPMAAPGGILGHVVARRRKPWDAAALAAVRHGATSAALQLVHQRELESAARRLRTRFVSDLLTGSLEREAARRRALALGWDPSCAFTVLLARREGDGRGEDLLATATRLLASSLVAEHDGGVLAVVPARDRDERPELAAAAALRDAVPGLLVACSLLHD
ncbi:MAG TPA: PucR family transcriptional regulator ligand-binding domain-containing protein, partial [Conexibacter sp.]|nr:PucR family transcriptional regulator ligand-binding domain-containing protein [Conexibacter sp.]